MAQKANDNKKPVLMARSATQCRQCHAMPRIAHAVPGSAARSATQRTQCRAVPHGARTAGWASPKVRSRLTTAFLCHGRRCCAAAVHPPDVCQACHSPSFSAAPSRCPQSFQHAKNFFGLAHLGQAGPSFISLDLGWQFGWSCCDWLNSLPTWGGGFQNGVF